MFSATIPSPSAVEAPRRRGRKPGQPLSAAELAARRANLLRARAAPREQIYRRTEKRSAASRLNLAKAIEARRRPRARRRIRLNALKHGLFARRLAAESAPLLGESRRKLRAFEALLRGVFTPRNEEEERLVHRLALEIWRRLRLWRAMGRKELDSLQQALRPLRVSPQAVRVVPLMPYEVEHRALAISAILGLYAEKLRQAMAAQCQIERALRRLVEKRTDGQRTFKFLAPARNEGWRRHLRSLTDIPFERLLPNEWKELLDMVEQVSKKPGPFSPRPP